MAARPPDPASDRVTDPHPFPARLRWPCCHCEVYLVRDSSGRIWEGTDPAALVEQVRAHELRKGLPT